MKCTIPEISWHNREPVLSVDLNPISNETYRLATSGGDSHILIWQMSLSVNGAVKQELVSDLTRHQRAVNVVRWSPSGQYLASADDDANIIVWQQKTDNIPLLEGETGDKEIWIVYKILRGHKEDIYDLCWSVDGSKLFSGSVDNTAILWDLTKGKMDHILSDHKGFVQGVAWDPKDQLIATISTDRICRLFNTNGKQVKARIHKGRLPVPPNHYLHEKEVKYFYDDTFKSFFRRLQFSPEGSVLVVPSGHVEADECKKTLDATLVFTLDKLIEPIAVLPLKKQCSTAVRFCPILFELHEDGPDPIINLPYRMIFAVSTDHDIILYDTQQTVPFARFQDMHYARLTDLTWSSDGRLLIASSTDGFCALVTFDVDELGVPYVKDESEAEDNPMDVSGCKELEKEEEVVMKEAGGSEKKRPSFIEQWALKTAKRPKLELDDKKNVAKEENDFTGIIEDEDDVKELSKDIREEINKLIPRRATETSKREGDKSIAKPIAVRRKPKREETATDGAKPIAVRRKPRVVADSALKENTPANNLVTKANVLTEETAKEKTETVEKKVDVSPTECDEIIEVKDTEECNEIKSPKDGKQEVNLKSKPSSTKMKTTPSKNNPLLKFLKNSAEKKKKPTKKGAPSYIDLTISEEEARDAWKCEKEAEESSSQNSRSSKGEPLEDDCTEDFCLQLEDTQESDVKNEAVHMKRKNDALEKAVQMEEVHEISDNSNDSVIKTANTINVDHKVPRRVPFITLASPKGRKKQKP